MENETMAFIQSFNFVRTQNYDEAIMKDMIITRITLDSIKQFDFFSAKNEQKFNIVKNLTNILSKISQQRDSNQYEQFEMLLQNQQMITLLFHIDVNQGIHLTLLNMNNLASYLFINDQVLAAKMLLKFLTKHLFNVNHHLEYIIFLNLSRIYYNCSDYEKSFQYAEQALLKQEPFVFDLMKHQPNYLLEDPKEIVLLLNGYLLFAKSLDKLENHKNLNSSQFYQNGCKLSRKYLGSNHFLSKRFIAYEKKSHFTFKQVAMTTSGMSNVYVEKQCRLLIKKIEIELSQHSNNGSLQSESVVRQNQFHEIENKFKIRQVSGQTNYSSHFSDYSRNQYSSVQKLNLARIQKQSNQAIDNDQKTSKNDEGPKTHRVNSARIIKGNEPNSREIETIIQKKFEELIEKQTKQQDDSQKMRDMETQLNTLKSENHTLQIEKKKNNKQIESLEKLVVTLEEDSKRIQIRMKDYDLQQENLKKKQIQQQQWQDNHQIQFDSLEKATNIIQNESQQQIRNLALVNSTPKRSPIEHQQTFIAPPQNEPQQNKIFIPLTDLQQKVKSPTNQSQRNFSVNAQNDTQFKKSVTGQQQKTTSIISQQKEYSQHSSSIQNNNQSPKIHISDEMSTIKDYNSSSEIKLFHAQDSQMSSPKNGNAVTRKLNKLTQISESQNMNSRRTIPEVSSVSSSLHQKKEVTQTERYIPGLLQDDFIHQNSLQDLNCIISTLSQNQSQIKNSSNIKTDSLASFDQDIFEFMDDNQTQSVTLQVDLVLQKRVLLDGILYDLSCSITKQKKDLQLKLMAKARTTEGINQDPALQVEKIEYLDLSMLKDILPLTNYRQILPYSVPMKSISDHKAFIQYLVMPFVGVSYEENAMKLEMWPSAQGILQDQLRIWFFEEECQFQMHFLQGREFRLIILSQKNENVSLKLDILFDLSSMSEFFEQLGTDEMALQDIKDMVKLTEIYDDQEFDDESRKEVAKLVEKRKSRSKTFQLPSFQVKDMNRLFLFFEKVANDIQILTTKLYLVKNFTELSNLMQGGMARVFHKINASAQIGILGLKVWDKAQYQRVVIVANNEKDKCFEIHLANLFETHAPKKQKVKAEGFQSMTYTDAQEKIGLAGDRSVAQYLLLEMFKIDVFESELDPEDYDRYRQNMILEVGIESESNQRFFQTIECYKTPVTLSYMGINENPMGLKVQLYNFAQMQQYGVLLLFNNSDIWKREGQQVHAGKKKRVRKFLLERKLTSNYHLPYLLNKVGWQLVYDQMNIDFNGIHRILPDKSSTSTDRLDNIITFQNMLDFFSK